MIYHVLLDFAGYPDSGLDEFAANVATCLTGSAVFPMPPVKPADLSTSQKAFHDALLAAVNGGTQLTAIKNEKRDALVDALRQNAAYVQSIASHNLSQLLSSGYQGTTGNHAQTELDVPPILSVDNGDSGQLIAHLGQSANAHSYQIKVMTADGKVVTTVDSTQARRVLISSLTPGTVYTLQARAVGGSTGYSDWSDPVSHMAT